MTLSIHPQNVPQTLTEQPRQSPQGYALIWRQRKLMVRLTTPRLDCVLLPPLQQADRLIECLAKSPVDLVKLSPAMDAAHLIFWGDICEQAHKPAYLSLSSTPNLPQKSCPLGWWLKRSFDWWVAAALLVLFSPLMAVIALLVKTSSPGPIFFSQWRVGERGKLFRIIKFRTMVVNAEQLHHQVMGHQTGLHKLKNDPRVTPVGRWLRKLSLDELPQLWNVLRGEMSLVGPRPWALYDAVRIVEAQRQRLNALPGITGAWQVNGRSHLLDLHLVNSCDLHYLRTWSLWQDLKFLMLTIPKVLTGFGAY